ncbi:MAG TPA: hypothetical protein VIT64_06355, partial [Ilumatobacteraceae bacterium]
MPVDPWRGARRDVATAIAILVIVAITGALVALIRDSSYASPDSVEFVCAAAITAAVPPTVAPPPVSTTTITRPQPVPSTSTAPATTSTAPIAPIAPIATYPADIGVLAPSDAVAPARVIIPELD